MPLPEISLTGDLSDRFIVIECRSAEQKRQLVALIRAVEPMRVVCKRIADGYGGDAQSLCKDVLKLLNVDD